MQSLPTTANHNYEHVFFYTDELEEVELTSVEAELEQSLDGVALRLTLFNGTYLRVHSRHQANGPSEYWLNLAFLDPRPIRRLGPVPLALASASGLLAGGSHALARTGVVDTGHPIWGVVVPSALALALTSLGLGMHRSLGRLVFVTRHGRAPVLSMSARHPDRRRVRQFTDRIQSAIRLALTGRSPVRGHYLRDEMKEHRRLQQQGVLDARQFATARAAILKAHG